MKITVSHLKLLLEKLGKNGEWADKTEKNSTLKELFQDATPVYPDVDEVYEITFEDYIIHQTRNESYATYDEYEIRKGNPLIIFEKSRLLDLLPQLTACKSCTDGTFYLEKSSSARFFLDLYIQ